MIGTHIFEKSFIMSAKKRNKKNSDDEYMNSMKVIFDRKESDEREGDELDEKPQYLDS